jgi:hypothetical protein
MSRVGKIACLPADIREEINRRLHDGVLGTRILAWLNSNEEVRDILSRGFDNPSISPANLTQWHKGGYRDWELQQRALTEARQMALEEAQARKIGGETLKDRLDFWLTAQCLMAAHKAQQCGDQAEAHKMLHELCRDFLAMRRADNRAEFLRIEQDRLRFLQRKAHDAQLKLATPPAERVHNDRVKAA